MQQLSLRAANTPSMCSYINLNVILLNRPIKFNTGPHKLLSLISSCAGNHHNSAPTTTGIQVEFSCYHCLRMSGSTWSAKGEVKERFSSSNNGTHMSSQKSDSYWDSNALAIQQSHKASVSLQDSPPLWPHREMLPLSQLYQSHVLACRCSSGLWRATQGSTDCNAAMLHLPCEPWETTIKTSSWVYLPSVTCSLL